MGLAFLPWVGSMVLAVSVSYSLQKEQRRRYLLFAINLFITKGMRPK